MATEMLGIWKIRVWGFFPLDRNTGPGWCGMRWKRSLGSSRPGFRQVKEQQSLTLKAGCPCPTSSGTPSSEGIPSSLCMKSLHSFPWRGVPGGPNGYKLLYFSLSTPIMIIFISACSHNSGLCLSKLLNCMSPCMCLPLHLRWAVALRFGIPWIIWMQSKPHWSQSEFYNWLIGLDQTRFY